jgi:hypothetical protein
MAFHSQADIDQLKRQWTDRLITVKADARPELKRFEGKVGRVVTVSYSGRAVVDFADGAWYDVPQFENVLIEVTDEAEKKKYDATTNSAQPKPTRQG